MNRVSNFKHLKPLDASLAAYGRHAARYFVDDADTALIKTRQFAERLADLVADHRGLLIEANAGFSDRAPRDPGRRRGAS